MHKLNRKKRIDDNSINNFLYISHKTYLNFIEIRDFCQAFGECYHHHPKITATKIV
jgi:hypothetical protein